MKLVAFLLCFFALVSSAISLKDDICGLPHAKNGIGTLSCLAYSQSWSYKPEANECLKFIYGGCGGNLNRFVSKEACEEKCKE